MSVATPALFAFDNSFVRELDGLYVPWQAAEAPAPRLLALNAELAGELGTDPEALRAGDGVAVLVGNALTAGAEPVVRPMPGTSSAATRHGWVTAGRCCWARSSAPTATGAICTSRAPGARRSRAAGMARPSSGRCSAST